MPSRWMSLTIVACWLAAMGWLFWHDLWPNWKPGEPPPFHIDLVEEVQRSDKLRNSWTVRRQKAGESVPQEIFRAFTSVEYIQDEDAFLLKAEYNARRDPVPGRRTHSFEAAGFRVVSMSSQYRVDRAGELRGLRAKIEVMPLERMEKVLTAFGQKPDNPPYLLLWGEVRGNELFTHCKSSFVPSQTIDLPPAPVSHNGSVIMPLHPVNRIHGLRPGQSWRQPMIDPFRDAFSVLPGISGGVSYVSARVLPEPQILELGANAQTRCLVIEYEEDGQNIGSTWVEEGSERVQRQEASLEGDRWIMQRDVVNRRTLGP